MGSLGRGGGRQGLRPLKREQRGEGARLRPAARTWGPARHLGDEAAERAAQVVRVAAQAGQPAALAQPARWWAGTGCWRPRSWRCSRPAPSSRQLLAAPHAAARPEPPRAAGSRRPELAGSTRAAALPPASRSDDRPASRTSAAATSAPAAPLRPRFGPLGLGSASAAEGGRRERVERGGGEPRGGPGERSERPPAGRSVALCSAAPAEGGAAARRGAASGEAGLQPGGAGAGARELPHLPVQGANRGCASGHRGVGGRGSRRQGLWGPSGV